MENQIIEAATLGGSVANLDFSILSLFLRADPVVKAVIILLLLASIWCWAIIFDKLTGLRRLNARSTEFEQAFWSGNSLDDLYERISNQPRDPMSAVFVSAMREWRRTSTRDSGGPESRVGIGDRIDRVMQITLDREMDRTEKNMTFLATTGSTAPFIGLFGTVWGIMNSFQAIAISKNTSLAVVAPGIAEALFATALGLLAAIPAVVAFNKLSKDMDRYAGRLDSFAGEFSAILSREMERGLIMAARLQRSSVRSRGRHRTGPMSEINVTPMVDVMLVLLVIFMVTAPLLTVGVQVDLPKTKASIIRGEDEPLAITVDREGQLFLQETKIELEGLLPRLTAITGNNPDVRIFVRGDAAVDYGRVMEVMGTINAAGYNKVALVTRQLKKTRRKK